ncbi:hypothetical protein PORCAN_927 [Porphyromonas crevioricanis JCM 13913]|nr:hypothetical protein PORCAN_927 [Porphyromonas crevioricanis JCM 13913]
MAGCPAQSNKSPLEEGQKTASLSVPSAANTDERSCSMRRTMEGGV